MAHRPLLLSMVLCLALPFASYAESETPPSQVRGESQPWEERAEDYRLRLERSGDAAAPSNSTPQQAAVALDALRIDDAPDWSAIEGGLSGLTEAFRRARDARYLKLPEMPSFLRRSSWLYPDDGCFARAALVNENLGAWSYTRPGKLFIFGNLRVRTPNTGSGWVSWWYHVVPVVRFANELWVFDPAIEPKRPVTAREWVLAQVPSVAKARVALCGTYAYEPGSSCHRATSGSEKYARQHQADYLRYEWDRLAALGRAPRNELGDRPPWLESYWATPVYPAPSSVTPQ